MNQSIKKNKQIIFMKHFSNNFQLTTICFFLPFFFFFILTPSFSQPPRGINLAAYRDWSSEFAFKDIFKSSREWITFNADNTGPWDTGITVPMTATGYPVEVPFDVAGSPSQMVRTLLFWDLNPEHGQPEGEYTLSWEGRGIVRVRQQGGASMDFNSAGSFSFSVSPTGGIIIEIRESDASNPVRNIHFVLPGFSDDFEIAPFNPEFLSFLENFQCIRFMDWMNTNGSPIIEWGDRTLAEFYSQAQPKGVAYEYLTQLCNTIGKDAWVNIPHQASDDYIEQFAIFLKDHLDPELKIYLEYSNELWNTAFGFPQTIWVGQQGGNMGYPAPVQNQRRLFTAKRSADIFQIFESVFVDNDRLVKVLSGQAGNINVAQSILNAFLNNIENVNPSAVSVDALAIAPYFGNFITDADNVDDVFDQIDENLDIAFDRVTDHQNMLLDNAWNILLTAYEGGQHLNGNSTVADAIFCQANRDERMYEVYCDYLQYWFDNSGGLFTHYNSISKCSANGSWGLKEHIGQADDEAPKFRAVMDCVISTIEDVTSSTLSPLLAISPNPVTRFLTVLFPEVISKPFEISIFNPNGKRVHRQTIYSGQVIDLRDLPDGIYFVKTALGKQEFLGKFVKM